MIRSRACRSHPLRPFKIVLAKSAVETVFIIDDDEAVRDSLKLLLEAHAMHVREFASVSEFLLAVEPWAKGCLILDLHLPVISGLDFLVRYRHEFERITVVMLTGRSDPGTRTQAINAGVTEFLEKPIADDQLMNAVNRALAQAGNARDHHARTPP
jgi:two-component system, LuxR family, response regulator FixJ